MDKNSLNLILQNFISDINSKSILIDGPWGCGKTYQTKEFIKANKREKIYYLSLFGLESIDEINTALYEQTRKRHRRLKQGAILISKAIKAIPVIPDISDALEYQLGSSNNLVIKKKSIIILDDLERLSDKVQYLDLMGYINSLYLSGCRFICLMSSSNVAIDRKNDFDEFKEKVFDCIYKIPDFDENIVNELFDEFKIGNISEVYELFESNLRLAQKTKIFYEKVLERININKEKHIDFNKLSILKACIYVVNICFKTYDYEPNKDDYFFEGYCESFGRDLAKNIYHFSKNEKYKKDYAIPMFSKIVESLISAFYYQDFNAFDEIYFIPESNQENNILDYEFYYLSDEYKEEYIKEFVSAILSKKLEWNDRNMNRLRSVLMYSDYEFDLDTINEIALLMNDKADFRGGLSWTLGLVDGTPNANTLKFINQLEECLKDLRKDDLINKFNKSWEKKEYYELTNLIESIGICNNDEKNEFLNYIVLNDFFIPDISKNINHNLWSYCHSMARFAAQNGKGNLFVKALSNMHKGIKTKSELDRCYALVIYNIGKSISMDELK